MLESNENHHEVGQQGKDPVNESDVELASPSNILTKTAAEAALKEYGMGDDATTKEVSSYDDSYNHNFSEVMDVDNTIIKDVS
ncbi:hypothetical protein YC2023_066825 [Brassica napus]